MNLTILSNKLSAGTTLLITLTISADTRSTSKTITLDIVSNLFAYIDILFNAAKVETSLAVYIDTKIISTVDYNITWSQVSGDFI